MDSGNATAEPPQRGTERHSICVVGRANAIRSILEAASGLRDGNRVLDILEQARRPRRVEVRQEADRHAARLAIKPCDARGPRQFSPVRAPARDRARAGWATRQCCRPPCLARNVRLEGERPLLAQLHLSRPAPVAAVAGLLLSHAQRLPPRAERESSRRQPLALRRRLRQDRSRQRARRSTSRITTKPEGQHLRR